MIAGSLGPITLIGAPGARKLPGTPNIRIDTILVLIPVTVIDQSNRLVMGLPKEDFHLFEENREQNIISFHQRGCARVDWVGIRLERQHGE